MKPVFDDMYNVMKRIDDIQKRFGLKRHNVPAAALPERKTYEAVEADTVKAMKVKDVEGKEISGLKGSNVEEINRIADYYADRYRVPGGLVKAVIQAESGYRPGARSPKGAMGLMQLMPSIASKMGVTNPYEPKENIRAGTELLGRLLENYGGDLKKTLAAYNAGPEAVDRSNGVPDYRETRQYVDRVINSYLKNR